MRRSWQPGRPEITVAVLFSAVAGVLALLVPIATGYVAQEVIPSRDVSALVEVGCLLSAITDVQLLLRLASQRALLRLGGLNGTRLQRDAGRRRSSLVHCGNGRQDRRELVKRGGSFFHSVARQLA